jgi:hypothetical protein
MCNGRCAAASAPSTERRDEPGAAALAADITQNARRDAYGHPSVNHGRTATLWSAYLHSRGYPAALSTEDVCWMNVLQKISRDIHSPQPDNLTDAVGYILNIEEIRRTR